MSEQNAGGAKYTAVIYVHGMGSQRRFEETSRLVDSIDKHLSHAHHVEGRSLGFLTKIRPRIEPARDELNKTYTYIRTFFRSSRDERWADAKGVRFYEVYWAPIMAGHRSPWRVLKWMVSQAVRPWATLRSPWRERQRLRRAALMELRDEQSNWPEGVEERDFKWLSMFYNRFERLDAHRKYPKGTFKEFLEYVEERSENRPETLKRRIALAEAWFAHYRSMELKNAFVLTSMLLLMALLGAAVFALSFALLQRFTDIADWVQVPALADAVAPTWEMTLAIVVFLLSLVGFSRFLTDSMGDVEAWATYEETDEKNVRRKKIIDKGVKTISHVLQDERCERVAVVAHSLGTTIAHDTLLTIARLNRAENARDPISGPVPLKKIEHFITLGSPIDKIEYFFESYQSRSHRFRRVTEELRGDIGQAPFSRNRKPFVHWVNFWDDGDPISGALHSPAGAANFIARVDNVHVASLPFPKPGASHSAYFANPDVVSELYEMIYHRKRSFQTLPRLENRERDWASAYLGPAFDPPGKRRVWFSLAILFPWTAFAGAAAYFVKPEWGLWSFLPATVILLTLMLGFLFAPPKK